MAVSQRVKELLEYNMIQDERIRRRCRGSYSFFFRAAWDVIEPETPLVWNWHIEYIAREMQKQAERIHRKEKKEYNLVINVPPRSLKSSLMAKCLPAWVWTWSPGQRFLMASYDSSLALEHAVDCRRLIQSPWYQGLWGDKYKLMGDQNIKGFYQNDKAGYRISTSVGGSGTGRGGNWVIVDDPISADDAPSDLVRQTCNDWWTKTMHKRLNDPEVDIRVIIQQRLHEEDLTGYVLAHHGQYYKHICLPAEIPVDEDASVEDCNVYPPSLRRYYVNGLLFPQRYSREQLAEDRATMLEYGYAGQMMQRPAPLEGGLFKRRYWKYWVTKGVALPAEKTRVGDDLVECVNVVFPDKFDDVICSWDMTFKDTTSSDYVVGQVWGIVGADRYLIDQVREKMDFPMALNAVKKLKYRYPAITAILVEDKANGPAIIAMLRSEIPGIIAINPDKNKTSRAMPMARQQQSGNIMLPHPLLKPWVSGLVDRFAKFPNVKNDDEVDAADQAINFTTTLVRVWPQYHGETYQNMRIDWNHLDPETSLLASQWVTNSLQSSVILGLWNQRTMRLCVFLELETKTAVPEVVVKMLERIVKVVSKGTVRNLRGFRWYGNHLMISNNHPGGDMRVSYRKHKINVLANTKYEDVANQGQMGAIAIVSRLLTEKRLLMHPRLRALPHQAASWNIEGKSPALNGFGLCRALCLLVSVLNEQGKFLQKKAPFKPYSKKHSQHQDRVRKLAATGDFRTIEQIELGRSNNQQSGWMV